MEPDTAGLPDGARLPDATGRPDSATGQPDSRTGPPDSTAGPPDQVAALVTGLGHPVLVEDAALVVVAANPALIASWGTDPRTSGGHAAAAELLFADPSGYLTTMRRRISERRPVVNERVRFADGRVAERDYVPIPLAAGTAPSWHAWIFRDVTAQSRDRDRLADEHHQLIELNQAKDRFLAAMSHELRTPLTSIISCTELLSSGGIGPLEPVQAELLAVIDRGASRLLGLISDLLLLARLESGGVPLDLRPIDPTEVVERALVGQRAGLAAEGKHLDTEIDPGARVNADPDRLARVVKALLTNARELTATGGRIGVHAYIWNGYWTLCVTDPSPAPEPEPTIDRGRVAAIELAGGASVIPAGNLNLLLSRNIVTQHGGSLTLRHTEHAGTTVTVLLPLLPEPTLSV